MPPPKISVLMTYLVRYCFHSDSCSVEVLRTEVYLLINLRALSGSLSSTKSYTFSEFFMNIGVVNVVITDTHTTIGYRKSLVTPRVVPREQL